MPAVLQSEQLLPRRCIAAAAAAAPAWGAPAFAGQQTQIGHSKELHIAVILQGNTHAKRSIGSEESAAAEGFHVGSPPMSPGSPLTYTPQVQMEPIQKQDDSSGQRPATEFVGAAGWPAQPKLVPVVIACEWQWAAVAFPVVAALIETERAGCMGQQLCMPLLPACVCVVSCCGVLGIALELYLKSAGGGSCLTQSEVAGCSNCICSKGGMYGIRLCRPTATDAVHLPFAAAALCVVICVVRLAKSHVAEHVM